MDKDEAQREEILHLSLRWQDVRDCAELAEYYGHDVTKERQEMVELQAQIRKLEMETGIYIRTQIEGKWETMDISDPRVPDETIMEWLRSRGGSNPWAEGIVMVLLGRNPDSATD